MLVRKCNNLGSTCENEDLNKMAFQLKKDKNKNVYSLFEGLVNIKEVDYADEEVVVSNHIFTNKMNILKEEFGIVRNLPLNARVKSVSITNNKNNVLNNVQPIMNKNTVEIETNQEKLINEDNKENIIQEANEDSPMVEENVSEPENKETNTIANNEEDESKDIDVDI